MICILLLNAFSSPFFISHLPSKDFGAYQGAFAWLKNIEGNKDFNVLYLPMTSIVRYKDVTYPQNVWGRNTMLIFSEYPSLDLHSIEGAPTHRIAIYVYSLLSKLNQNDTEMLAKILGLLNIKYIIIFRDVSGIVDLDGIKLENVLKRSSYFSIVYESDKVTIFQNLLWKYKFFTSYLADCIFVNNLTEYFSNYYEDNRIMFYFSCPEEFHGEKRIILEKKNFYELLATNNTEVSEIPIAKFSFPTYDINKSIDYYKIWWVDKSISNNLQDKVATIGKENASSSFFISEEGKYIIAIKYLLKPIRYPISIANLSITMIKIW